MKVFKNSASLAFLSFPASLDLVLVVVGVAPVLVLAPLGEGVAFTPRPST